MGLRDSPYKNQSGIYPIPLYSFINSVMMNSKAFPNVEVFNGKDTRCIVA